MERFDPACVKPHRVYFLIGRRGTGKSVLLLNLMRSLSTSIDFWLLVTPTTDTELSWRFNRDGSERAPQCCIIRYDKYDKSILARLMAKQDRIKRRGGTPRSVAIVLDDCMYDKGSMRSEEIRQVLYNGRHSNITLLVTSQYLMDIDAGIRVNIDYVFTFRDDTPVNVKKMREYYCGAYSAQQFQKVYHACTEGYRCMVVDRIRQRVEWYLSPFTEDNMPPFRLCSRAIWQLWNARGVQRREEDDQDDAHSGVRLLEDA